MTIPFDHLKVGRAPFGGWHFVMIVPRSRIGTAIRTIPPKMAEVVDITWMAVRYLPNFRYYASLTTAGWSWMDLMFAFFTSTGDSGTNRRDPVVVVGVWWDELLVINLRTKVLHYDDCIVKSTRRFVLEALRKLVTDWQREGKEPESYLSKDMWYHSSSIAHHAGLLGIHQAAEQLWLLAEFSSLPTTTRTSYPFGRWSYRVYGMRRTAQIALRRLGHAIPRPYPAISFRRVIKKNHTNYSEMARSMLELSQKDQRPDRHVNVRAIREGMSCVELAQLLGVPDFIGRMSSRREFWRYDIDLSEDETRYSVASSWSPVTTVAYTLLVYFSEAATTPLLEKAVRYSPPFWRKDIEEFFTEGKWVRDRDTRRFFGADNDAYVFSEDMDDQFKGQAETIVPEESWDHVEEFDRTASRRSPRNQCEKEKRD